MKKHILINKASSFYKKIEKMIYDYSQNFPFRKNDLTKLSLEDLYDLQLICAHIECGEFREALKLMSRLDTAILEHLPFEIDDIDKLIFEEHLKKASKIVSSWPEWEQNILGKVNGKKK